MRNRCYKCKSRRKCKKYKEENRIEVDDLFFTIVIGVMLSLIPLSLALIPLILLFSS